MSLYQSLYIQTHRLMERRCWHGTPFHDFMPENAFDPPNKNEIECGRRPIQSNRFGNNRKWVIEKKKRKSPDKKRIQPMAIGKNMVKYEALSQWIVLKEDSVTRVTALESQNITHQWILHKSFFLFLAPYTAQEKNGFNYYFSREPLGLKARTWLPYRRLAEGGNCCLPLARCYISASADLGRPPLHIHASIYLCIYIYI